MTTKDFLDVEEQIMSTARRVWRIPEEGVTVSCAEVPRFNSCFSLT